jgi:acyl-CoA thioester hydrolase
MADFRFFHPIEVRYADIDAQGHANNAVYFTYMEQARALYIQHLGLWEGSDFNAIGIILAEATCTYKAPIHFGQTIRVGVKTVRLGNRSLELNYSLQDAESGQEMATGRTIQVAYDYPKGESIPIPEKWRRTVEVFEGIGSDQA